MFFGNVANQGVGNLQLWENIDKLKGSYSGRMITGGYNFWLPDDIKDKDFYRPLEALRNSYPVLIMSGNWTPSNPTPGLTNIMRAKITTVYEFKTSTNLYPMGNPCCMETQDWIAAMGFLASQPTTMPNGEHWDRIKQYFGKAKNVISRGINWYNDNADTVNAIGSAVKTAGLAALTLL